MGMDVYGKAFIGLKVKKEDVLTAQIVKTFEHNYPENYRMCPITGRALWRTDEVVKSGFSHNHFDDIKCGNYEVRSLYNDTEDYIIVLMGIETGSHRCGDLLAFKAGLPNATEINSFKEKLKDLGLWDENNFGLWVQTSIS